MVLEIRVPFLDPQFLCGTPYNKDPNRDPNLDNYPHPLESLRCLKLVGFGV